VVKQKIDEFGIVTLVTGPRACGDGDQVDPVAAEVDAITRVPLLACPAVMSRESVRFRRSSY